METHMQISKTILGSVLILISLSCIGSEVVGQLNTYFIEVDSFQGNFLQTVWDENNQLVQESRGTIALDRPGRFRWQYLQPHRQLILADGKYLWVYDEELQQAVAKPITEALGSVPIMLLTNPRSLYEDFKILATMNREGLSWVELAPLIQDAEFRSIQIGMNEHGIQKMELYDHFSQRTAIEFSRLELNVSFPKGYFMFEAPLGVDVVGYSAQ